MQFQWVWIKHWKCEGMVGVEFHNDLCFHGISGQQGVGEAYGERKGFVGGRSIYVEMAKGWDSWINVSFLSHRLCRGEWEYVLNLLDRKSVV